jgi:osmotically-inducible protein OsmY
MKYATKIGARALVLAGLLAGVAAYPQSAEQQTDTQQNTESTKKTQGKQRPDNTRANKVENNGGTADQQKNNSSDLQITRRIRRAIVQDKSLSTYAHNVKIITKDGGVTLKGPVHTEDEKNAIESKAAEVVGQDKVKNEIKVVPNGKQPTS